MRCFCNKELTSDYIMHFVRSSTTNYVMMKGPIKNISQVKKLIGNQILRSLYFILL